MVISKEVIRSKEEFHVVWLMGSGDSKGLSRRTVLRQNLPDICELIIKMVPDSTESTKEKIGLYLLSLLARGTILIHRDQVDYLQRDVERLKELMRKKCMIQVLAENFDREQEHLKLRDDKKSRSTPIRCIEDVDDVNLEVLPFISAELGIDADPRFITIPDALEKWGDDLERLYGSVQSYTSLSSEDLNSTHVVGQSRDERSKEKRTDVVDMGDIVQSQNRELEGSNKRSTKITDFPVIEDQQAQYPAPTESIPPMSEPPRVVPDFDFDYEMPPRAQLPYVEQQEPRPSGIDDIGNVPPQEQRRLMDFFNAINSMPDEETHLPPIPVSVNQDDFSPPPAKQPRVDTEVEQIARENPRRNLSSRPITPVNQTSMLQSTIKTNDHSTTEQDEARRDAHVEQESIQFSPIVDIPTVDVPPRRRRRRINPQREDAVTQMEETIRETLEADWTSLVRRREDVILLELPPKINVLDSMDDPRPNFSVGCSLPRDLQRLFKSNEFKVRGEAYGFMSLCISPTRNDPFDEEYRQIPAEESNRNIPGNSQIEKTMEAPTNATEVNESVSDWSKYWFTCLQSETPATEKLEQQVDESNLLPHPDQNRIIDDFDFPNNVVRTDNRLENARHRPKSSIGVQPQSVDDVQFDSTDLERRAEREKDRLMNAMNAEEDELFYYSSGSLLQSNKEQIHKKLLSDAEETFPEWLNFKEFTKGYSCKDAATAFDGLLLSLKNMKVRAKQDEPFSDIFVQHVRQDED